MTPTTSVLRIGRPVILVAEPNEIIRKVVREILVRQGFRVLAVSNATSAQKVVCRLSSRIAAIVMESAMRAPTGFDLLGELAKLAPDVPALVISNPMPGVVPLERDPLPQAMEYQRDILPKPFPRALLLSKLHALLEARRERERAPRPSLYKTASHAR